MYVSSGNEEISFIILSHKMFTDIMKIQVLIMHLLLPTLPLHPIPAESTPKQMSVILPNLRIFVISYVSLIGRYACVLKILIKMNPI